MSVIETYLRQRGIRVWTHTGADKDKHCRRGWIAFLCPRCLSGKPHLGFNLEKRYFNCWNCGRISNFEVFRLWFPGENVNTLLTQLGFFEPFDMSLRLTQEPSVVITGTFLPPSPIYPLEASIPHQQYLASRGLDWQMLAKLYAVGAIIHACTKKSKFNQRLFVPVHNATGKPVSWLTRSILSNVNVPYITASPEEEVVSIKTLLYGMNYVTYYDPIIVVEGATDMWRINQTRPHSAVATLGKKLTPEQLYLISRFAVRVLCFDGESITQQQAEDYCRQLSVYPGVTHNVCLDAPDPCTAPQLEIDALLKFTYGV